MRPRLALPVALLAGSLFVAPVVVTSAGAEGRATPRACTGCASHEEWPEFDGVVRKAKGGGTTYVGTERSDELLGRHGSDTLRGMDGSDVLWGDWDPKGQPSGQFDRIEGGEGEDFIYSSHGRNSIKGGAGNDAISAHYGRGTVDCGPGRDIYHVPKTRKASWSVKNCEKVDRRSEKQRGGGLEPLS